MAIITIILTAVVAILPALIWLIFFLREDRHPEPKKLIFYTFLAGGLISFPVLATQIIFQAIVPDLIENLLVLIIGLALIEEVFKFAAAYWAVNKKPAFDEPIDAMIYMIAAALGFATVENIFIIGNGFNLINAISLGGMINVLSLRFIGATLLHTLTAGLIGYYWAKGKLENKLRRKIIFGLAVATLTHSIFNYLILRFQESNLLYPSLFLIVAAFFILNDFEKLKTEKSTQLK